MQIERVSIFASNDIEVGKVTIRPTADIQWEPETSALHSIFLPVAGLCTRHESTNRKSILTPNHAIYNPPNNICRYSYPGLFGEFAVSIRLSDSIAPSILDFRQRNKWHASQAYVSASTMLARNFLWSAASEAVVGKLELESLGIELASACLLSMVDHGDEPTSTTSSRRRRAVENVVEAVAASPSENWTIQELSAIAGLSAFHLCRIFKAHTGLSVGNYVIRERLSQALRPLMDGDDITDLALSHGFSSHSHFTYRFRRFFGLTPSEFKKSTATNQLRAFSKILIATNIATF
ncbi:MAG: helix-turn-helix transcriptional regulator [Hyphomicrobiaceae bacterium]|nr:helix-turn-helix transcriptional regulator [Hyphomicrobiaceae bacterium]